MRQVKHITGTMTGLLTAALVIATPAGAQEPATGMSKQAMAQMERSMSGWPKASREAAAYMANKYGAPKHINEHTALWEKTGPWKRTIVYNYEVGHQFPAPHTDVMQQWIDYKVPLDMYDDLAKYDGSVVAERTNGELSARCDKEGANFLALNLAHEIASGKRNPEDARKMYGEQIMAMQAGQATPYTKRLLFIPKMGGTADPDQPLERMTGSRK